MLIIMMIIWILMIYCGVNDFVKEKCVIDMISGEYIIKNDAIEFTNNKGETGYVSQENAEENLYFCEIDQNWYDTAEWSEYSQTYIPENKAVKVYNEDDIFGILNNMNIDYDWRWNDPDDSRFFVYKPKKVNEREHTIRFDEDLIDNFVLCVQDVDDKGKEIESEWYHKEYDKNLIHEFDGMYCSRVVMLKLKQIYNKKGK